MAARTEDATLKIESTNIHVEMVSRNTTKTDGIPSLKGPWRRKLQRTGMRTLSEASGHILERGKKPSALLFHPHSISLVTKQEEARDTWRKVIKGWAECFLARRDIYCRFTPLFGHLASWLAGPARRVGFMKQGGPRTPALTLPGVPSFTPELQLTVGIRKTDESRQTLSIQVP